jgi:hypothetical protein
MHSGCAIRNRHRPHAILKRPRNQDLTIDDTRSSDKKPGDTREGFDV